MADDSGDSAKPGYRINSDSTRYIALADCARDAHLILFYAVEYGRSFGRITLCIFTEEYTGCGSLDLDDCCASLRNPAARSSSAHFPFRFYFIDYPWTGSARH